MKRIALIATTACILSACSTMPGVLEEAPEEYLSAKTPDDLAICLSEVWTKRNKDVRVNPMPGGQRVVLNNPVTYGPLAVVEVRPAATSGSQARYWKGAGPTGWTRDDLKGCL